MLWSPEVFEKALQYASIMHQGQRYRGETPEQEYDYLTHVVAVAMRVIYSLPATPQCDANLAIQCALLHDTLEDTQTTYESLADTFGLEVAAGVQALSKDPFLPKHQQMLDSLERIQQQRQEIWMVKLADRTENLQYIPWDWDRTKINQYRQEAQLILNQLGSANSLLAKDLTKRIKHYTWQ